MSEHEPQPSQKQELSLHVRWKQSVLEIYRTSASAPLNQLTCHLDYAVYGDELLSQEALRVLEGERNLLLKIQEERYRGLALAAFDALTSLRQSVAYITREFVREECGICGAVFSDEDCDIVIAEVQRLAIEGKFDYKGVYWIANALAADGLIHPSLPKRKQ
jgi:hypothetical protein